MGKVLKPISFNDVTENDILEYIDALEVPFASYVKKLIKQDMEKSKQDSELGELISLMKDMLKNNNNMMMMPQMAMMMPQMAMMGNMMQQQPQQQGMQQQQPPQKNADEDEVVMPKLSEKQSKSVDNLMSKFSFKK